MSQQVLPILKRYPSGPQAAARLERARPETKVLFMSGYTDDEIVHHGVLDETVPFIEKPFTPEELARKIRTVMLG